MNIKEAKTEIANTLRAYHLRDDRGNYRIPTVHQRPILLMGPPGIGKTAILQQVAEENGVGLVSYTLTHHTRQSAVGLPRIEQRCFAGETMAVTEYTMSEIIASVYTYMEKTGKQEGILFLDEVNCVSETLAPTMLQLLQNKTFGEHKVPEGWILVTAGNPPEFNKSVREFDVATLDRVRTIQVEADCGVWLEYAQARQVHGAILSYLAIRPEHFYLVEDQPEGKFFVTARGWEDLSQLLRTYEALEIPVTKALVSQYLQKEEVAREFAAYYQLYRKYDRDYGIPELLAGEDPLWEEKRQMAAGGSFEEKFTLVQLLMDGLTRDFLAWDLEGRRLEALRDTLKRLGRDWGEGPGDMAQQRDRSLAVRQEAGLLREEEQETEQWVTDKLREYDLLLRKTHIREKDPGFAAIREAFGREAEDFRREAAKTGEKLKRAFRFCEEAFGEGQELVLLVTDLTRCPQAVAFLSENGSDEFLKHSDALLYRQQEKTLQAQCRSLLKT